VAKALRRFKTMAKQLKVTYVRSAIGYNKKQAKIIEALGFKKLNQTRILPDNESIRGSIFHVKHLLNVEEVE
jgi:large subunit ribosomal protein L30